jgi:colanic acid/amylovoran biosynthesis protein
MDKFVILPTCSDLNRGDQALVWQTMDMAKKAGCDGTFYMLASDKDSTKQSQAIGIRILAPILKHPSRKFKSQDNNEYNLKLIVKWGSVAIVDLLVSLFLLIRFTRMIIFPLLPKNEKQTLKTIEESNACFVKGGGFIHSSGKITDSYTVYYQLFHILLAQSLNKPVYVMPNSFGPFPGLGIAWLYKLWNMEALMMEVSRLNILKVLKPRASINKEFNTVPIKTTNKPTRRFSLK